MDCASRGVVCRNSNPSDDDIKRRTREYWDSRSRGYKESTRITLREGEADALRIIGRFIDMNRQLRVVDMGTGAGLLAILLAQHGHIVTAVDNSEHMLEVARENAEEAGVKIEFLNADIESPPLKPGSFDLVVSRSTVWGLPNPRKAYAEWKRLLKTDGEMAIIDGNYYLDLFDDDYRRRMRFLESRKADRNNGLHARTNVDNIDFNIICEIARELPLSRERRPAWDVAALMGVGMTSIHVKSLDKEQYSILTENGIAELPSMFVVCAKMPMDETPYMDAVNYPLVDNEEIIRMAESFVGVNAEAVAIFKALGDVNRIRIVNALLTGRMNVQQIAYVADCTQSLTSHNLNALRKAGLVRAEKVGREMLYSVTDRYRTKAMLDMCEAITRNARETPDDG